MKKNKNKTQTCQKSGIVFILVIIFWTMTFGSFVRHYFSLLGGGMIHTLSDITVFIFLGCFLLYGYFFIISFIVHLLNRIKKERR